MVGLVGVLIGTSVLLGIKGCHNTDTTYLILRVHEVTLITKGCEIHSCTCTKSVDEGDDRLSLTASVCYCLCIVVLCPSTTAWSVDEEHMTTAKRMVSSAHHHIAMVDRAIRATATITSDRTVNSKHGNEWEVLKAVTLAIGTG